MRQFTLTADSMYTLMPHLRSSNTYFTLSSSVYFGICPIVICPSIGTNITNYIILATIVNVTWSIDEMPPAGEPKKSTITPSFSLPLTMFSLDVKNVL